jgi:hypothetical protein
MPFWAPSFCNGTPLLANINAAVFYPPKLLVYTLPLSIGYALFLTFHTWLSMVGMHILPLLFSVPPCLQRSGW